MRIEEHVARVTHRNPLPDATSSGHPRPDSTPRLTERNPRPTPRLREDELLLVLAMFMTKRRCHEGGSVDGTPVHDRTPEPF